MFPDDKKDIAIDPRQPETQSISSGIGEVERASCLISFLDTLRDFAFINLVAIHSDLVGNWIAL
jgi:hypothetical protein